jgi:hypothetical protein
MEPKRSIRRGDVFTTTYVFPHERDATSAVFPTEKERPILILQNDAENDDEHYPYLHLMRGVPSCYA